MTGKSRAERKKHAKTKRREKEQLQQKKVGVKLPQVVGHGGETKDEPNYTEDAQKDAALPLEVPFDPKSVVANILKKTGE